MWAVFLVTHILSLLLSLHYVTKSEEREDEGRTSWLKGWIICERGKKGKKQRMSEDVSEADECFLV